jgi:hypothetical protein
MLASFHSESLYFLQFYVHKSPTIKTSENIILLFFYVLEIFLCTTASRTALGSTQPPTQWVPEALSLRVKRRGREADHSPPSSAEVQNAWSYTSTPPIRLHGVVLGSAHGQFYLPLRTCKARFVRTETKNMRFEASAAKMEAGTFSETLDIHSILTRLITR